MKIAVLFARRINKFEKCIDSHYKYIFNNHDITIFLAHNSININDDIESFKKEYKTNNVVSISINLEPFIEKYKKNCGYHVRGYNCIYMFVCLYESFMFMKNYAHENNIEYDII